jgi:hypothetical protein
LQDGEDPSEPINEHGHNPASLFLRFNRGMGLGGQKICKWPPEAEEHDEPHLHEGAVVDPWDDAHF